MHHYHSYKPIQVSGLSAAKMNRLVEQLGHLGLSITPNDQGFTVTGDDIAGNLHHNPSTGTLTVELRQVPTIVTPGYFVGRLYDEILSISES